MTPALINHIVDTTAMVLGISREAICSSSRKRANVIARNIITDVAYNDFLFKYHEIGAVLKRNHSTLIKNKLSYEQDIIATPEIKYITPPLEADNAAGSCGSSQGVARGSPRRERPPALLEP